MHGLTDKYTKVSIGVYLIFFDAFSTIGSLFLPKEKHLLLQENYNFVIKFFK